MQEGSNVAEPQAMHTNDNVASDPITSAHKGGAKKPDNNPLNRGRAKKAKPRKYLAVTQDDVLHVLL